MDKRTELVIIVGAIMVLASIVTTATTATTEAAATETMNIFYGFVGVMFIIGIIGMTLIADESRREERINYMLKETSMGIV